MLKVTLSKPKSPPAELWLEGVVEELRRDKKAYQKTAMLQLRSVPRFKSLLKKKSVDALQLYYICDFIFFKKATTLMTLNSNTISHRQPFQTFPQTLLLRETFTVDLLKGLYILESKAGFHGNREVIHTLTLGYRPPSPFVSLVQVIFNHKVREYLITVFGDFNLCGSPHI